MPKAGSQIYHLLLTLLRASCTSFPDQISLPPWTSWKRRYELSPSFTSPVGPSSLEVFPFGVFFLFLSVFLLLFAQPFYLWGVLSPGLSLLVLGPHSRILFLSSHLSNWPRLKPGTAVSPTTGGSSSRSTPVVSLGVGWGGGPDGFCFPQCILPGELPALSLDVASFPAANGPSFQNSDWKRWGIFLKRWVGAILAFSFPIADFLGLENSRARTQIFMWTLGGGGGLQLEITAFSLEPSVPPPRSSHSALMVCSYVHISVSSRRAWRSGTLSLPGLLFFFCPEGEQHTCGLKLFFSSWRFLFQPSHLLDMP